MSTDQGPDTTCPPGARCPVAEEGVLAVPGEFRLHHGGVLRDVRSSGSAEVQADIRGTLSEPVITGSARLVDGRTLPVSRAGHDRLRAAL